MKKTNIHTDLFVVACTLSAQRTKKAVTINMFRDTPILFNLPTIPTE